MTVTIQSACNLIAGFTIIRDSLQNNLFYFTNTSTPLNNTDSIRWTFGDGSVGYGLNASHAYNAPGTYQVCLRVQQRVNGTLTSCIREYCSNVNVGPNCNITANFNWMQDSTSNTIYFGNTSNPINSGDSTIWLFGDGTSAYTYNATHTYANTGTYQVCMRTYQRVNGVITGCYDDVCRTVTVVQRCNLNIYFSYNLTPNGAFNFTAYGAYNTDSIRWNFGDGSSANTLSTSHVYLVPGTYQVCLRVIRPNLLGSSCVDEYCRTITVPGVCNLQAGFTHTATNNGYTYYFNNTSTGMQQGDTIRWTFGDGTSSSAYNPSHTYNAYGTYTVCLRIKRATVPGAPACVSEYCRTVNVVSPCNIQANYSWQADSTNANHIYFNNQSIAPATGTTAIWYFGDGTSSNSWNADHIYRAAGVYRVCLRLQYTSTCVVYKCDSITVQAGGCYANAEFNFYRSNTNSLLYQFNPRVTDSSWTYSWNFGDSTGSNAIRPAHTYSGPGTYNVCLTVTNGSCTSTFCRQVYIAPPVNCNSIQVSYVYRQDPYTLNKYYFYTLANYPVLSQIWTFSKIGGTRSDTLRSFNPIYMFQDTGYFNVCLKAFTLGGCVKDTCQIIHIQQVTPAPSTCFIGAYPNPASSNVNWNVYLTQSQPVIITVYNSMNTVVRQQQYAGLMGNNNFSMFVGNLVAGNYYVRITYGNSACYSRFMKY
jgi:PKD repeat protein